MFITLVSGVFAQWEEAAAYICGDGSVEEMEEFEIERFAAMHDRPLDLNAASGSRLLSSGLLSAFQVNELIEYRRTTGDVLSYTELALVPGFQEELAEALKHFTVLRTSRAPGQQEDMRLRQSLTLRGMARMDGSISEEEVRPEAAGGLKYAAELGERAAWYWSSRTTYDSPSFGPGTISAALYWKRRPGKVIAGDFAARFGQGLVQWSGFSLSSYSNAQSFRRNASGLSPTGAYSSTLKGVAADCTFGRWTMSAALPIGFAGRDGVQISPMVNATWTSAYATVGMSGKWSAEDGCGTMSVDFHAGLPDISTFGEFASKLCTIGATVPVAAIAGAIWKPVYGTSVCILGRYYSPDFKKDWSGAAAGFENGWLTATADISYNIARDMHQYKFILKAGHPFTLGVITASPSVRASWRYRPEGSPPSRLDIRADISAEYGNWALSGRYNYLCSREHSWLWYAEPGYSGGKIKSYLRFTLFCIDNWDDRIYVYERDAPGSFNVPSYYGRGYALSFVGSVKLPYWRKIRSQSLNIRISRISYKWNLTPKPSRFEIRLQYGIGI